MIWEILILIIAIVGLLWYKKNQADKHTDYTIQRLPAIIVNKDIESRLLKYHYFIAFRIEGKKTTIFEVSEADYYTHEKGEQGTLIYQHHEFIRFDVKPTEQVQ